MITRFFRLPVLVLWMTVALHGQMTVVNGASFMAGSLAPGSIASIFGQNLCPQTGTGTFVAPGQLSTTVRGCSVTVGGIPAMLFYVSPGQINLTVPSGLAAGTAPVVVSNGGGTVSGTMNIAAAGPGVFSMNGMGVGIGAMLHGTAWTPGPFSTTTNGSPTPISMFLTGLDLSTEPTVEIGGLPAEVLWCGNAPGYVGLQQINFMMPGGATGSGEVPAVVTAHGVMSNVTFLQILPTTAMMQGMPGWSAGMQVEDNQPRAHEAMGLALNPANNTVLVSDENGNAVRIVSADTASTIATIAMPNGSLVGSIEVNDTGTLAAAMLPASNSVALIDLTRNAVSAVVGTGYFPMRGAFAGTRLLVANQGGLTVTVVDTTNGNVLATVNTSFGPSDIGVDTAHNRALVTNLQAGTLSAIDLTSYAVTQIPIPAGIRPMNVAVSAAGDRAVISSPMTNGILLLNLSDGSSSMVDTGPMGGVGPGAIAINGTTAYVANQMSASISVVDLGSKTVKATWTTDPGPRRVALDPTRNHLVVLAEGTNTVDLLDLTSGALVKRLSGILGDTTADFDLPLVSAISPASATPGSSLTISVTGNNLSQVTDIAFVPFQSTSGGGMMGGGMGAGGMMSGSGMMQGDAAITVSNVQPNATGTQIAATLQIAPSATPGTRYLRLLTSSGYVMSMSVAFASAQFTVVAP